MGRYGNINLEQIRDICNGRNGECSGCILEGGGSCIIINGLRPIEWPSVLISDFAEILDRENRINKHS